MRTELSLVVLFGFLGFPLFSQEAPAPKPVPSHVVRFELPVWRTEQEVKDWARSAFQEPEFVSVEERTNKVLIILRLTGSGIGRVTVYIYGFDRSEKVWRPLSVFLTNTRQVKVEQKGGELRFKSKAGKILFVVPMTERLLDSTPAKGEY